MAASIGTTSVAETRVIKRMGMRAARAFGFGVLLLEVAWVLPADSSETGSFDMILFVFFHTHLLFFF